MDWTLAKRSVVAAGVTVALIGFSTSCEWTSGGGVNATNGRYNFVNFSGVYKASDGGVLVSAYTGGTAAVPATSATTNSVSVNGEVIGTGNGSQTAFSGALGHSPLLVGSITISAPPAFTLTDVDGNGVLTGTSGSSGTINYSTGAFSVDFGGVAIDSGSRVTADYAFLEVTGGSNGSAASRDPGSSGGTIYSFTVDQFGNGLTILDNNGATYTGNMGDIRSTGGVDQNNITTVQVLVGDTFIGQYGAGGVSAAGKRVSMSGTFQGIVTQVKGTSFTLGKRQMFGTWVEQGGKVGDINGSASPVDIQVSVTTTNDSATVAK